MQILILSGEEPGNQQVSFVVEFRRSSSSRPAPKVAQGLVETFIGSHCLDFST